MEARRREKEAEAGITDGAAVLASLSQDSEERDQLHRDSASTLNRGSSAGAGSVGQSYELQPTETVEEVPSTASLSVTVAGPGASANEEEGNSQQVGVCVYMYVGESVCVCVRERERERERERGVCVCTCTCACVMECVYGAVAYGRKWLKIASSSQCLFLERAAMLSSASGHSPVPIRNE